VKSLEEERVKNLQSQLELQHAAADAQRHEKDKCVRLPVHAIYLCPHP